MTKKFDKLFTALKYYLIGKDFNTSLKSLQFARQYHSGKRKDEESVISAELLHDIPVEPMNKEFGEELTQIVLRLSKRYQGKEIPLEQSFDNISKCPIASIVKGWDRTHNLQSRIGVTSAYFNIKHILKSQLELVGASLK